MSGAAANVPVTLCGTASVAFELGVQIEREHVLHAVGRRTSPSAAAQPQPAAPACRTGSRARRAALLAPAAAARARNAAARVVEHLDVACSRRARGSKPRGSGRRRQRRQRDQRAPRGHAELLVARAQPGRAAAVDRAELAQVAVERRRSSMSIGDARARLVQHAHQHAGNALAARRCAISASSSSAARARSPSRCSASARAACTRNDEQRMRALRLPLERVRRRPCAPAHVAELQQRQHRGPSCPSPASSGSAAAGSPRSSAYRPSIARSQVFQPGMARREPGGGVEHAAHAEHAAAQVITERLVDHARRAVDAGARRATAARAARGACARPRLRSRCRRTGGRCCAPARRAARTTAATRAPPRARARVSLPSRRLVHRQPVREHAADRVLRDRIESVDRLLEPRERVRALRGHVLADSASCACCVRS